MAEALLEVWLMRRWRLREEEEKEKGEPEATVATAAAASAAEKELKGSIRREAIVIKIM